MEQEPICQLRFPNWYKSYEEIENSCLSKLKYKKEVTFSAQSD